MIDNLKIKIFADGADLESIKNLNTKKYIKGFTTNPSLMKKAGIKDYKDFAIKLLSEIKNKPISFEVFSDDIMEMEKQAEEIASWGENVNVKIPITNTKKLPTTELIRKLSAKGITCNITAIFTIDQMQEVVEALDKTTPAILSVFAGRIADTGRDPMPTMQAALKLMKKNKRSELIWASTREIYNIYQAHKIRCHIITVTGDLIKKFPLLNYNLEKYSLDTVKSFRDDAVKSKFKI